MTIITLKCITGREPVGEVIIYTCFKLNLQKTEIDIWWPSWSRMCELLGQRGQCLGGFVYVKKSHNPKMPLVLHFFLSLNVSSQTREQHVHKKWVAAKCLPTITNYRANGNLLITVKIIISSYTMEPIIDKPCPPRWPNNSFLSIDIRLQEGYFLVMGCSSNNG